MALLTILMPAYNASAFVKEAVESLLNQSFRDFELWIVDDASIDDSLSIIKTFQDRRIKLFSNPVNLGRVRTINELVKKIDAPYFTITDADDVSHPQRLEKQINFLKRNLEFVMCGTSYWAMDERGFLVRSMKLLTDVGELRSAALKQSQFLGPTTVMRKEIIDEFPDLYRTYFTDNFADADLSSRILDRHKATNIDEPHYFYRIVRSSVSRKKITVRNLNLHLLIGYLSKQRREQGLDCLQQGSVTEADDFMNRIESSYNYDASFFFRHLAYFHLYWGLTDLARINILKALRTRPLLIKNCVSLFYIIFRIGWYALTRSLNKKHYSELLT